MKQGLINKLVIMATVVGVLSFLMVAPVLASSKAVSSENGIASVKADEVVDGAAFMSGKTVTIAGKVNGDVYCVGDTVHVYGEVNGDVICAGSTLTIEGKVKGDVRVIGSNISIRGVIQGNLSAGASTLSIEKNAIIERDALLAGSSARLDGTVGRDLKFGSEAMELLGSVGRNVDGDTTNLVVSDGAKVGGNVQYWSSNIATIYEGTVAGDTIRHEPISYEKSQTFTNSILGVAASVVFLVILSIGVIAIAPRSVRGITALSLPKLGFVSLIGLGAILIAIPILLVLIVTIVGMPIALLVLVGYLVLFTAAFPVVAYYIGRWMFEGRSTNMVLHAMTGAVVLGLVMAIPILGALLGFVALAAGVGAIIYGLRNQFGKDAYKDAIKISELNKTVPDKKNSVDALEKDESTKSAKR